MAFYEKIIAVLWVPTMWSKNKQQVNKMEKKKFHYEILRKAAVSKAVESKIYQIYHEQ